jgi:hypothetical protein
VPPLGDLERPVEIVRLDEVVPAEVLLRVDERTVGDDGRRLLEREVLVDDRVLLRLCGESSRLYDERTR